MKNTQQRGSIRILLMILGAVIIGAVIYLYLLNRNISSSERGAGTAENVTNTETEIYSNDPWVLFDKIRAYSKAHNEDGLASLSYNHYPPCGDKSNCDLAFSFFEAFLATINKSDYTERREDSKQIILATAIKKVDLFGEISYTKNYLFFARDTRGNLKFVGNNFSKLSIIKKDSNLTEGQMLAKLELAVADTDRDGLGDLQEKCQEEKKSRSNCKKTDPLKEDTDGNGWWDGVQALFLGNSN